MPCANPPVKDSDLQKQIKAVPWGNYIEFGWIKIKILDGKPTLVTVEKTDRID